MLTSDEAVVKAWRFATKKHEKQTRKISGEPYVNHCIRVSIILSELTCMGRNEDKTLIVTALLHDILENTDTTLEELQREFGERVTQLVYSLSNDQEKVSQIGKVEYLKSKIKLLDSDGLLIKLADRLDNVSDLKPFGEDTWSDEYAKRTIDVFFRDFNVVPLSPLHSILLGKIRRQLLDLNYLV